MEIANITNMDYMFNRRVKQLTEDKIADWRFSNEYIGIENDSDWEAHLVRYLHFVLSFFAMANQT